VRRLARTFAAAVVVVVAVVVSTAGPASAHAQVVSTDPAAGATLPAAPKAVTVTFDDRVEARADSLRVYDSRGRRVDQGALTRVDGGKGLRVAVGDLADGGYMTTWRVVSDDGHPVSGGASWRVGTGTAVDLSMFERLLNAEGGDTGLHVFAAVVRALLFGGLVVLVGGLGFVLLVWPAGAEDRRARRTLVGAAAVAGVASALSMGVEAADTAGRGIGAVFQLGDAVDTWHGTFGKAAVLRIVVLLAVVALASRLDRRGARTAVWRLAIGLGAVALFATVSASGHARTGRWTALALPLDIVHQCAGALWLGGLAFLALFVLPRAVDSHVPERFSRLAMGCVLVVTATGVVQGFRQLRRLSGVRETDYGRILVVKVVLVALVVVFGGMSRSLLRARDRRDDGVEIDVDELRHRLRLSVGFETMLGIGVLVVTSLLVAANPSQTIAARGFAAVKVVHGTAIEVGVSPARPGPVTFHVYASNPSAGLTTTYEATATMSLASRGITGVAVPLRPTGRSHWTANDVAVPIAGEWTLRVTVVVGGIDSRSAEFRVDVH
jgi:copper transport protein